MLIHKQPSFVNTKKVIFHHDNVRPYTAILTKDLKEFDWKILTHPAYSPNLAPSDYWRLQNHSYGLMSTSQEKTDHEFGSYFTSKSKVFYKQGI